MTQETLNPIEEYESYVGYQTCPICGAPMEWEDCYMGCDEGIFTYEDYLQYEDPLWYDPDDFEVCDACKGRGGYLICPNAKNHPESEE